MPSGIVPLRNAIVTKDNLFGVRLKFLVVRHLSLTRSILLKADGNYRMA